MKKEYIYEVENMPQDEPISSSIGFHGTNTKMIELSDQFQQLKTDLMRGNHDDWIRFHALIGTPGIGKTTLAMEIYQDPEIHSKFECRAWVNVGRVPQPFSQILRGILADLGGITQGGEEIDYSFEERLPDKNWLIVLDDVWEEDAWNSMKQFYEYIQNGCIHVLLTGRHRKTINAFVFGDFWYEVRFLNEEESMKLLCVKVFGDEICPPELEKVVAKITKLCEGLPLMIVTVAGIISRSEQNKDTTYWNDVAERRNSVFRDAYNEIIKVLFPSYDYLPQRLKMPFLFMGVFPRDYNTPPSKIIMMLMAQGLLSWDKWECIFLKELAYDYNLVLRILKSVNKADVEFYVEQYKTCRLHSSWQHVCRGEASKNKLYHVLNKFNDASGEILTGQRGLCLENNILFGIKEFRESVRFNCAPYVRSLLLYGPYHQYPITIDVGFMLLREIDALTQRFYTFPTEILILVQLKYLALTCNGDVPATISKLFNLRVLIIHPHMNIRRCAAPSYVPIHVWDMQKLEHIEILGKGLVVPSHVASLEKLSTLVGVNASISAIFKLSCRIPKIKKLGIQIEITPSEDLNDLLSCLGCISRLGSLETLKLCITNPVINHNHVFVMNPRSLKFPCTLKKLHLSGMGFPWKYMNIIGSLPGLIVLKLRSYAFHGSHWKTKRYVSMKHCYKLEDIRKASFLDRCHGTIEIELEDCNPLALTWATQLQPSSGGRLRVTTFSSYYEKPKTFKCERDGGRYVSRLDAYKNFEFKGQGDDGKYKSHHGDTEEENDVQYTSDYEDTEEENEVEYASGHEDTEEENDVEYTSDHEGTEKVDYSGEISNTTKEALHMWMHRAKERVN
ncbi:putative late blight resistance protein homolog R1B-12 isoform X2 [Salvia hispanica]|uniref:putative late blight resistance protein homolog R1B-12 isoform X2 n=1 Tax=Salvia hispanica TaxID=49212 RepID=UPI002009058A|nr:putative late blight resistance protein homolog R1B-12 isoform X2 [Salvia hispanica]